MARLATLLCLGITILPLIFAAALLAQEQVVYFDAANSAQAAKEQSLEAWQLAKQELTVDNARASNDLQQLQALESGRNAGDAPEYAELTQTLNTDQATQEQASGRAQAAEDAYSNALATAGAVQSRQDVPLERWIIYAGAFGAVAIADALFIAYIRGEKQREFENKATAERLAQARFRLDSLQDQWEANQGQLSGYHQIVLNYAKSSRATTKFALISGFAFVLVVSVFAISSHNLASTVSSSVIASTGAVVTGFISRAVLRSTEDSSREIVAFFSHPLETQRLLIAQQIANEMSGEGTEQARLLILKELLHPESFHGDPPWPKSGAPRTRPRGRGARPA